MSLVHPTKVINNWHFLESEESRWFINQAKKYSTKEECSEYYNHAMFFLTVEPIFAKLKKPRRTAIDVGSSYGMTTIALANFFEKVSAFEIDSGVRDCLRLNVQEYPNVKVYNCGVSNTNDQIFYNVFTDTGHNYLDGLGHDPKMRSDRKGRSKGTVRTLDSFGFQDVDYIKIDVEGAENLVIEGAHNLLSEQDPLLVIESWNEEAFIKIVDALKPYGYEHYTTHKISDSVYATIEDPKRSQLTDDHIFVKNI